MVTRVYTIVQQKIRILTWSVWYLIKPKILVFEEQVIYIYILVRINCQWYILGCLLNIESCFGHASFSDESCMNFGYRGK